jgi:demethylmenaquinone methyltransferase/2-methoxy-6-polyprenyl-1,4-benzoquinol methylase
LEKQVTPYQDGESKKKQVAKMFNSIAPVYDFLNHFLSLGIDKSWRRKAISLLRASKPETILDIATGTGDLALEAYRQLQPKQIIGVDISAEMLQIGVKKIQNRQLEGKIQLTEGDSEALQFPDNQFDAITVAFGVRNFEHLEKGLAEMLRVLKPGGMALILEFSRPTLFPFKNLFNLYFSRILPAIGRYTSKDPGAYNYLYRSVQEFPDGRDFVAVLQNVGYHEVSYQSFTLGICSVYCAKKYV